MKTWTKEEVQEKIMSETQTIKGEEYVSIERMVEILTDPRMPDCLKEKSSEILKFLEETEKELQTSKN